MLKCNYISAEDSIPLTPTWNQWIFQCNVYPHKATLTLCLSEMPLNWWEWNEVKRKIEGLCVTLVWQNLPTVLKAGKFWKKSLPIPNADSRRSCLKTSVCSRYFLINFFSTKSLRLAFRETVIFVSHTDYVFISSFA